MSPIEFVALSSAVVGVYLLLHRAAFERKFSILVWRVSVVQAVGFLLAMSGFLLLLGLNASSPGWWGIIQEKRSESLKSWQAESGHAIVVWLLSITSIGSALVVVTAGERKSWLDASVVFGVSMAALFGFLANGWACCITLALTTAAGWARRELYLVENRKDGLNPGPDGLQDDLSNDTVEQTARHVEPFLVSVAGVLLTWLLVVSIHWAVHAEGAPERIRKTERGLPRVASSQGALIDEHTDESSSLNSDATRSTAASDDGWLIVICFVFMALSGAIGVRLSREPTGKVEAG